MEESTLAQLIADSAAETRRHFDVVAEDVRKDSREVAAETRRYFDVVAEEMKTAVQLVAEGIIQLGARVDREVGDLRDEMRRGFAETQAMIKFSYAELDRRVTILETGYARIDRLEERIQELERH